ncbi:MAG TPA: DUF6569 family protein [Kofleriaceae bacterium]|nr:DUF6569 family protein [Kofleriaceae bacterium]
MRPAIGLFAISLLAAVTAHANPNAPAPQPAPQPAPPAPADAGSISERAALLAPIQVESLTLTPIVATAQIATGGTAAPMLVLDEAMTSGKVKIAENDRESVNNLTMINSSEQPVFVLAGEVIIGGKQDRIIGANTVIPAKTTLSVPVYCVEHGRWDNSSRVFSTANALAHGKLRGKASFEAQGDVWKEVAETNAKRKTANATDTYRTVAKQQSDGTLKDWQQKVDAALAKVPAADRARMIGYVIALNGQVATVDIFQSPALFKKLEPKLLRSYVTEAVSVPAQKDAKAPTPAAVKSFMADADKAAEQRSYETKAAKTRVKKGARAGKASVDFSDDAAAPAASPPPAVYESYQVR